jgi:hypothetical protein
VFLRLPTRQLIVGTVFLALLVLADIGQPWLGATGWDWIISASTLAATGLVSAEFRVSAALYPSLLGRAVELARLGAAPAHALLAVERPSPDSRWDGHRDRPFLEAARGGTASVSRSTLPQSVGPHRADLARASLATMMRPWASSPSRQNGDETFR